MHKTGKFIGPTQADGMPKRVRVERIVGRVFRGRFDFCCRSGGGKQTAKTLHHSNKDRRIDRLDHVEVESGFRRTETVGFCPVSRHCDQKRRLSNPCALGANQLRDRAAVQPRHSEVEQDDIGHFRRDAMESLLPI
jgi:hypothetical protein